MSYANGASLLWDIIIETRQKIGLWGELKEMTGKFTVPQLL